jgi:PEP-CTERM motif
MRTITKLALMGAASLALAGPANAAVITFSGLLGPSGSAFSTITEAGFIITRTAGTVNQMLTSGSAAPSLQVIGGGATIEITRVGGGNFTASAFDVLGIGYAANAYIGGSAILGGGSAGFIPGGFTSAVLPTAVMDRLVINLNQVTSGLVDNISLTESAPAVPEPATWAMMLAGFGLVGASLRRSKQTVRVKYA